MTTLGSIIAPHVLAQADQLHERFVGADPFAHCVIDGFFDPVYAHALLKHFPAFERGHFLNEAGDAGGKSTVQGIRRVAPEYAALDDCIQSPAFLDLIGSITGIPGLLYDPDYFGGGTHENRDGQSLDNHIDFNYHPRTDWHRRLNLIVYLNPEWNEAWGGSLELHRDPQDPETDTFVSIAPAFNRCVIFETTEHSWHGFQTICLPAERKDVSRRSIALYFYTRDRPEKQTASRHSTIYVDRALPDHYLPGRTLTERDVAELRDLLQRRDSHNQRLYREMSALQQQLDLSFAGRLLGVAKRTLGRLGLRA